MRTQLSNIIQSGRFLGKLFEPLSGIALPLVGDVFVHLVLSAVSDAGAQICKKKSWFEFNIST